jgi:hypothetical protein
MGEHRMRRLDELARLWNDTRSRLPQSAWSWPLAAAVGGAAIVLLGTSPSDVGTASNASLATVPIGASTACHEQTWPYLSDACLQRTQPAGAQPPSHVRVLNYEPAMAHAAIGATPWAPKATARSAQGRQKPAAHKQATQDPDRSRTVTVRSGRRDRERVYNVPNDAYSAYGYVPRR